MGKRFLQALLISIFATLGIAKFASAANVPVDSSAKVHICYNYSNVDKSYNFAVWDIGIIPPSDYADYMTRSGWPATNNTSINYVAGTHNYSTCYDYYFNNSGPHSGLDIGGQMVFTNSSPRQVVLDIYDGDDHGTEWTYTRAHYYATFEVHNTTDTSGNITGQEAVLLYVKDASGTKVNQLDFDYVATSAPVDLTITNTVRGDMADTNKYFKYTVNIGGATGTYYTVSGTSDSESASLCAANMSCDVYAKHGETIVIGRNGTTSEIPVGTTYSIVESNNTGYTTAFQIGTPPIVNTGDSTGTQTLSTTAAENVVAYYNTKNGTPITGLFTNYLPYLIIAATSACGIFFFAKKKHSKNQQ